MPNTRLWGVKQPGNSLTRNSLISDSFKGKQLLLPSTRASTPPLRGFIAARCVSPRVFLLGCLRFFRCPAGNRSPADFGINAPCIRRFPLFRGAAPPPCHGFRKGSRAIMQTRSVVLERFHGAGKRIGGTEFLAQANSRFEDSFECEVLEIAAIWACRAVEF